MLCIHSYSFLPFYFPLLSVYLSLSFSSFQFLVVSLIFLKKSDMYQRQSRLLQSVPTLSPTFQVRGECENSELWRFDGDVIKTCKTYVAVKPKKRCKKVQPGTKKKLKFFCPSTCKRKCKRNDSPTS